MQVLPTYVCSNHLFRSSTWSGTVFPRNQLIHCGHLGGACCEARERVSGGTKPVSRDLRTSSKTKKVVHMSLDVHHLRNSKSTGRRGVW